MLFRSICVNFKHFQISWHTAYDILARHMIIKIGNGDMKMAKKITNLLNLKYCSDFEIEFVDEQKHLLNRKIITNVESEICSLQNTLYNAKDQDIMSYHCQELVKMQILVTNFLRNSQNHVINIPFYCFF